MKPWHPLSGEIPPDPPEAPWHFEPGDSPADIIRAMREVWHLVKGGTSEHAQALFDKAGTWLDYWLGARAGAEHLGRKGIRVKARKRRDTWSSYLARYEPALAGIRVDEMPPADAVEAPDNNVAQAAILAIWAAHQAILTGRDDLWSRALEQGAMLTKAGEAIKREAWRKAGGESRRGKRGPIRMVIGMLVEELGTTDVVFQEVPASRDRGARIEYTTGGAEKSIAIATLQNILSDIATASRNAPNAVKAV